jgi:uncharacterized protein
MATLVGIAGIGTTALDPQILLEKQETLFGILRDLGQVLVAYSGGTDSAYLAWAAGRVLGENAVAITADSASIPESHKKDAEEFAREAGFVHEYIPTFEFDNPSTWRIPRIAVFTARMSCSRGWRRSALREAFGTSFTA